MTVRKVLRDRGAATYLGGVLVSGFGDSAMLLVAGIWVKTLTGSSSLAAAVTACVWAPTLAGPLLGTAADRVRRRRLLIGVNAALAVLLPALLAVRSGRDVWLLLVVLAAVGTGSVLCDAAEAGLVVSAVPAGLRGDFNGLRMTVNEAMKLLAPLAGAGLFLRWGGGAVALLDAVTFGLAALAFAALRVREEPPASAAGGWRAQTAEGVRALRGNPLLLRLVGAGAVAMLLSGVSSAAIYELADAGLHRLPAFVGVLYAVQGAGSIVAGTVAGAVMRRLPERAFAATGLLLFAAGAAVRAVPSLPVVLAGTVAIGVGLPWVIVAAFTAVQQHTEPALVGRVAAAAGTVVFAPTAVAAALGAVLVALVDYRLQLVAVGAGGAAAAWLLLLRRPAGARVGTGAGDGCRVRAAEDPSRTR
ncbi:MFS transporter [Streptomyces cocklensis]|uniref:Predicted arabinose efflux permease, MFS family n=1 Tax=Actinacidiphila cocklensis TaxID=887465 RepID=A0A9W4GWD3_9ACTN|nr:MFS transporter [Actinacidiphila cocklensis]MDD1060679.1 MFS transporter [Actinacidiphila cocklensis]CAG6399146.1 Predicted arabinose efflux permease, MFS family [Actinacidiphila cocklensis]